jgi:hypothetical protein
LYCSLEFLCGFQVVITEFFELPLVFDSIGEVVNHLPIRDVENLSSNFCKAVVVLLKGFVRLLFASFELVLSTWSSEYSIEIFTEFVLELSPGIDGACS